MGDTCSGDMMAPLAMDADLLIHEATNAWFREQVIDWLIDWLTVWLTDWLIDWLTYPLPHFSYIVIIKLFSISSPLTCQPFPYITPPTYSKSPSPPTSPPSFTVLPGLGSAPHRGAPPYIPPLTCRLFSLLPSTLLTVAPGLGSTSHGGAPRERHLHARTLHPTGEKRDPSFYHQWLTWNTIISPDVSYWLIYHTNPSILTIHQPLHLQMAGKFSKAVRARKLVLTHFSPRYRGDDSGDPPWPEQDT